MSTEVKVPVLPESVSDATIATWHKKAGEKVSRDENLVDLETDKVMLEVPAPQDGVLKEIVKDEGETVSAEDVIGILEAGDGAEEKDEKEEPEKEAKAADKEAKESGPEEEKQAEEQEKEKEKPEEEPKVSPAARRLAEEEDADLSGIEGSGRGGLITKEDVQKALESDKKEEKKEPPKEEEKPEEQKARKPEADERGDKRVPMSRIRARIAERMVQSKSETAMLTSFNEVDLKAVMDIRKRYKEQFEQEHGIRLGLMSFFVKACIEGLKKYPVVNASVEDKDIVYHQYYDIGIAVSTERGLMVPVLRSAEHMSIADIEEQIRDYAEKARKGSMTMEDLQGGTFTITNGGVFGSLLSTPIINPPQSAILGMHAIKERPVVVDGNVTARPMMYIALSYDHRLIDGKDAVLFLVAVKEALEDPARILLGL